MVIKENINIGSYVRQTYKKNINNIIVKKVGVARLQQAFELKFAPLFAPLTNLLKQT